MWIFEAGTSLDTWEWKMMAEVKTLKNFNFLSLFCWLICYEMIYLLIWFRESNHLILKHMIMHITERSLSVCLRGSLIVKVVALSWSSLIYIHMHKVPDQPSSLMSVSMWRLSAWMTVHKWHYNVQFCILHGFVLLDPDYTPVQEVLNQLSIIKC